MIIKYHVKPPDSINAEVYAKLSEQVGTAQLTINLELDDQTSVTVKGTLFSVEGDQFGDHNDPHPVIAADLKPGGPSSVEADREANSSG